MYWMVCCLLEGLNKSCITSWHLEFWMYEQVPLSPERRILGYDQWRAHIVSAYKFNNLYLLVICFDHVNIGLPLGVVHEAPSRFPPKKKRVSGVSPFSCKKSWMLRSWDGPDWRSNSLSSSKLFFIIGPSWKWNESSFPWESPNSPWASKDWSGWKLLWSFLSFPIK